MAWGLRLRAWGLGPGPAVVCGALGAQGPSLDTVLANAAAYVGNFHRQLSQIVAEETYLQSIKHQQSAFGNPVMLPERRLKSDLLLVRPEGADRYVKFRVSRPGLPAALPLQAVDEDARGARQGDR